MQSMSLLTSLKLPAGSSNGDAEACISPDNKHVINLGYDFPCGYISIYDIEQGKETARLRPSETKRTPSSCMPTACVRSFTSPGRGLTPSVFFR